MSNQSFNIRRIDYWLIIIKNELIKANTGVIEKVIPELTKIPQQNTKDQNLKIVLYKKKAKKKTICILIKACLKSDEKRPGDHFLSQSLNYYTKLTSNTAISFKLEFE